MEIARHEMQELLGQAAACLDDRCSIRIDARTTSGLAGTASARAQVSTLRERFLKLGAHVIARCVASCCTCRVLSSSS